MPQIPLRLILLSLLLAILLGMIELQLLTIAFDKLGVSPLSGMALLLGSLFGSAINLPLWRMEADLPNLPNMVGRPGIPFNGSTMVTVNVGGCVIPLLFSGYLLVQTPLPLLEVVVATGATTAIGYTFSRPVNGLGIAMPALIAPLAAASVALLLDAEHSAPLAYISGTLGVLCGADLLRLPDVRRLAAPVVSIGGAGTFDGIFITGIVAALLA